MSEPRHTPGPWSVPHFADDGVGCDCAYVLADGMMGAVAAVYADNGKPISDGGNDAPQLDFAKANAFLIAAAPDMLAALKAVNKLITEAAMTGFNCHDGDWAERLFHSQQATSNAIRKAEPRS